ncbi:hypothetical protein [Methylobacterium sp. P1-11]|uniref:hypothetical protein n=1 Tax=Methylobacterium sp. P1-11 TaxID=2024616 RepID=UPI0011ED9F29|nr:hypothetical protein [Methylobacterium sp. P1-11]
MMLLKPLALAVVLILSSGNGWAQGGNPGAAGSSNAHPEKASPSVSDGDRPSDNRGTPKANTSGADQGTASKGMLDSAVGNGAGRADEDASAAAAR